MAKKMPKIDGTFVQAESEVAAINMVYGAASRSHSHDLIIKSWHKLETGRYFICFAELPAVIVNG